jgi:hypothetical protein
MAKKNKSVKKPKTPTPSVSEDSPLDEMGEESGEFMQDEFEGDESGEGEEMGEDEDIDIDE